MITFNWRSYLRPQVQGKLPEYPLAENTYKIAANLGNRFPKARLTLLSNLTQQKNTLKSADLGSLRAPELGSLWGILYWFLMI